MRDDCIEALHCRLCRVERESRRWRLFSIAAFAVFIILGMVAAQGGKGPKRIAAEEVAVLDKDGRTRILFEVTETGPLVTFRSREDQPRFLMGLGGGPRESDVPFLNFRSKKGVPRFAIGLTGIADASESPYLSISNQLGRAKVRMGLSSDDAPHLYFDGSRPSPRLLVGVDAQGEPYLIKMGVGGGIDILRLPSMNPGEEKKEERGDIGGKPREK